MQDQVEGPGQSVLEQLFEVTQEGIWHVDNNAITLDVNPAMCHLLGYAREDMVGRPAYDFVDPANADIIRQEMVDRAEGIGGRFEVTYRHRNGHEVLCFNTATPLTDKNGNPAGSIGLIKDISERKHAEWVLQQSEARFRDFAQTASDWFWETDADLRYTSFDGDHDKINEHIYQGAIGHTRAQVLSRVLTQVEKSNSDKWERHLADLSARLPFRNLIYERHLVNGEIAFTKSSGQPVFDSVGEFMGYRGSASDVTEEVLANIEVARTRDTMDRTLDCLFTFDPISLHFSYVNQGAVDQVGYTKQEMLTMTPVDIKPEFDEQTFRNLIDPLLKGEKASIRFETYHETKSGDHIPVEIVLQYLDRQLEGPARCVAVVRDITERREAEEIATIQGGRLKENEERLRLSLDSAGIGTFVWNIKADTHFWDERTQEIWGFDPGTYGGNVEDDFRKHLHPKDRQRVLDKLDRVFNDNEEYDIEFRIIRPNGDIAHLHAAAKFLWDNEGEPEKLIGVNRDITERIKTNEAILEREAQTRLIVDNIPVLINYLDTDQRILFCNAVTEKWYGRPASEIVGKTTWSIFDDTLREKVGHRVANVLAGGFDRFQEEVTYPDGIRRFVDVTYVPHKGISGSDEVSAYFVLVNDISATKRHETDLVAAKEEAEYANQAKSDFLANMSHELRTPLNAIIGYAQMVETEPYGPLGDDRYSEYVGHVRDSGDHLLDIIDDILDLTRIEAGKMKVEDEVVNLAETIQSCLHFLDFRLAEKSLTIKDAPEGTSENTWPNLLADPRMVRQMILNLLSNAMKFSEPNSTIEISGQHDSQTGLEIRITDNGIGMDEDEVAIAVERFGQVESILSRSNDGTGLGLPLVRSLIELHDGEFRITSTKGIGTNVSLIFPPERVTIKC
jgi:PAS domain S-box-containing protein